ncbi:glycosyltransferase family 39 protein [uncultured Paludibaculum sp.]|uniref:ArnT family glycosyltransferase n=1 Tax=uncultured Paludibaculum sp. TaxID=1765020 RepID=UPI002AAB813F|nr:glycosyltransferase family 39 protein [uncultured Paludibaculum sp.]
MLKSSLPYLAGLVACLLFLALGLTFIPYPGAQYDETLFVMSIHSPQYVEYAMKFGAVKVPIMLMTYIGTLKAAIYAPILHFFGAGHATLRLPVLLMGTASVWLLFLILKRLSGWKTAFLLALLLATDALYLLTGIFDWGPVALQHILFTAAVYCFVRFPDDRRRRWLFLGSFCGGLALWDKALFIWLLAGFGVALLAVFPRQLLALAKDRRHLAAVLLGFVLGAAPFLYYNKIHKLRTFTANTDVDERHALDKILMLDHTFDGSGLMGYMVREDPEGPVQNLKPWEKVPLFLNGKLGNPRNSLQHIFLVLALLIAPILCWNGPNRKAALLFLTGGVATFALMLITKSAGGSAHHTVLLWPVPQILAGLMVGEVQRRWPARGWRIAAGIVVLCVLSNLAVLNTYLAHFIACGPTVVWTDAIRPLVTEIGSRPGRSFFGVDWGITQQVEFYGSGTISYYRGSDGVVIDLPAPGSVRQLERALADPATLFVTHTDGHESFTGVRKKLIDFAAERGYHDEIYKLIYDRHGVPIFEIHEFRK